MSFPRRKTNERTIVAGPSTVLFRQCSRAAPTAQSVQSADCSGFSLFAEQTRSERFIAILQCKFSRSISLCTFAHFSPSSPGITRRESFRTRSMKAGRYTTKSRITREWYVPSSHTEPSRTYLCCRGFVAPALTIGSSTPKSIRTTSYVIHIPTCSLSRLTSTAYASSASQRSAVEIACPYVSHAVVHRASVARLSRTGTQLVLQEDLGDDHACKSTADRSQSQESRRRGVLE